MQIDSLPYRLPSFSDLWFEGLLGWICYPFFLSLIFFHRFNISFEEVDTDGTVIDTNESGRLCFSSISKDSGSLDKELAASGFTRKDQENIEKVWW